MANERSDDSSHEGEEHDRWRNDSEDSEREESSGESRKSLEGEESALSEPVSESEGTLVSITFEVLHDEVESE